MHASHKKSPESTNFPIVRRANSPRKKNTQRTRSAPTPDDVEFLLPNNNDAQFQCSSLAARRLNNEEKLVRRKKNAKDKRKPRAHADAYLPRRARISPLKTLGGAALIKADPPSCVYLLSMCIGDSISRPLCLLPPRTRTVSDSFFLFCFVRNRSTNLPVLMV